MTFLGATRRRKAIASGVVIALLGGIPVTIAALHPGFPVTDVELTSEDVWVTNGELLLGGRLNRQIDELNGSIIASTPNFDVLQEGDALFMHDPDAGRIESVDASFTKVTSAIDVPTGSSVSYGGESLAITSSRGEVHLIPAVGDLQFNAVTDTPILELGARGQAVLTRAGTLLAVSPEDGALYRFERGAAEPERTDFPKVGEFQLSAVGESAVVFDESSNELVTDDGRAHPLGDARGLRLQQVGADSGSAVVSTATGLALVDLGSGAVTTVDADVPASGADARQTAAPVFLDGCVHGAWGHAQRYVFHCDGAEPLLLDIEQPTQGSRLEFRVNGSVIALNNLDNGNVWLVDENMRLVENWEDVTPPEETEGAQGDEKSARQSFEETLAERTENNRPPIARDDDFGVRPGRTTILPLLDNDTDPDGDVLVIASHGAVAESTGILDTIDGGRALQFTPATGYVGTVAFTYRVDDGRGGSDEANVVLRVVPFETNTPPVEVRTSGVSLEANQTVSYNVLTDWLDPDGDDLFLLGAAPRSADLVRFTPDGYITFTHQTSEIGEKEVVFQVSDGVGAPVQGTLLVEVTPSGSQSPIGTPDFATTFVNSAVVIDPLINDLSPSGAKLALSAVDQPGGAASVHLNTDQGTVTFQASQPGVYYLKYTLTAGSASSVGLIRVDVEERPQEELAPIAVKDVAFLRGETPTTVSVLANDVSPSGRVLAVQSVDVAPDLVAKGLKVEIVEATLIRVTSPSALDSQVQFQYTVSDGINSSVAGVTVVPVPALTKHQPPVAISDEVTVRGGDIVTVNVLDNDFHPDDMPMFLDHELLTEPEAGLAFVSGNTVRFQAPLQSGQYRADYRVLDQFGESSAATVTFTVTARDAGSNRDPVPAPLTARVLEGGQIRVEVPLDSIDPDGDSVHLLNFPTNPALGSIVESGIDYFVYEAARGLYGTDEFSYEVYDTFGATGVGDIRIAVIPEPHTASPPIAVPDRVQVRPGRLAQVDLLANDSDPQGAPIKVSDELMDVPEGIEASVERGQYLLLEAPQQEQSFSLRYELTNNRGGSNISYVLVQVTEDAPLLPPTAHDYAILTEDIAGKPSIDIDLSGNIFNPGGRTEDLVLTLEGPNASAATLLEGHGRLEVVPGDERMAIAYRVTNTIDDLSALAFILVPAAADEGFDSPPVIWPDLPEQIVGMNETREWKLEDIVYAPSGRDVWMPDAATVTAVHSNGDPIYIDEHTIRFTPSLDYRGPAMINFTVTDGASKNDPAGNYANLRLPITVGDPEFRDTPPEFTPPSINVEVGETTQIDLRASTAHPNPQILQQVTYSNLTGTGPQLSAELAGSTLTVTTPRNTPKGTTFTLNVTLAWDKFEVPGTINVTVVSSSRPMPVAAADTLETQRGDGPVLVNPLVNDMNPYQSTNEPLRIIAAEVTNTGEPAGVSFTADTVTISPSPALKSGVIEVRYTIEDATQDPDRRANGLITLTVSDVPDAPAAPTRDPNQAVGADRSATWRFDAPASNGKPITSYEIRSNPSVGSLPSCTAGVPCTLTGLNNGTAYTLSVRAINEHGPGPWSPYSQAITPYGTPGQVSVNAPTVTGWGPSGSLRWTWSLVASTGGSTTYHWVVTRGGTTIGSGSGVDLTSAAVSGLAAGTYQISVHAENSGGKAGPAGTRSGVVENQIAPGAPRNVSGTVTTVQQPGAISWSWSAPSNATTAQVTDGMQVRWRLNGGSWGSWRAWTTGTTSTGLNAGNYSLTVEVRNTAGSSSASGNANRAITNPPPPAPSVNLQRGANVQCADSGSWNCYQYRITLSNFTTTNHTVQYWCNGTLSSITATFNGNSYEGGYHCGWPNAKVAVDGVHSGWVNFNP